MSRRESLKKPEIGRTKQSLLRLSLNLLLRNRMSSLPYHGLPARACDLDLRETLTVPCTQHGLEARGTGKVLKREGFSRPRRVSGGPVRTRNRREWSCDSLRSAGWNRPAYTRRRGRGREVAPTWP